MIYDIHIHIGFKLFVHVIADCGTAIIEDFEYMGYMHEMRQSFSK